MVQGITDIAGIKVGHASDFDALTGCTVVLCEAGAVAGVDIGGAATGTQEFDTMSPLHVAGLVHGIVFAGGSAFGLEAASGVRNYLEKKGVGFLKAPHRVPIVPSAILFDLDIGKPNIRPTREMGTAAAAAATAGPVAEGCIGAGTGATVGKLFGMPQAMKGGVGSFGHQMGKIKIAALAVVNAFGDVRDPRSGLLLAGARHSPASSELVDTERLMREGQEGGLSAANTTLVVVVTNAKLSKVSATRLAKMAQAGVLRALSPGHTMGDGDIVIAISLGNEPSNLNALGVAAADVVGQAIVRGVKTAKTLGGVPGLAVP